MSENDVAVIPAGLGMSVEKVIEASQDTSFVPWLTLIQASADAVKKNQPEGVRPGNYVLGGRKILKELRVKPLGIKKDMIARPYASLDNPEIESFTQDDENWKKVEAARGIKNGSQARVGTDMLLWLPDENSFAAFRFSNTYAREMPDLVAAYEAGGVAVFKSREVGKSNTWFVPMITTEKSREGDRKPTEAATKAAIEYFFAPVIAYREQKPAAENPTSRPR